MAPSVGPSLGWQIAHWIETLLCHGPGDVEGQAIVLDDEWLAAIVRMYELDSKTGRRRVDSYTLSRPKGRAKSELAGFVVCAEALGPVRFDHWARKGETSWWGYPYEVGEPVGRTPTYPFVRCLATEESQTGNTYDVVRYVLTEAPIAGEFPRLDVGLTRTFLPSGGEIRPSTAGAASKDGGKETFAVADEIHLYVLPEHRRMYDTVSRNLTKRRDGEPWMLKTTTMFRPGENSVAEVEWEGHHKAPTAGLVIDHREGPEPRNWNDDRQLRKSLRVAYGPAAEWMDLDRIVREIRRPTTDGADARRFFLNRHAPVSAAGWLRDHPGAWDRCQAPIDLPAGTSVAVGVDMSLNRDASAVAIAAHIDGRVVVRARVWAPVFGQVVDHVEILDHIRSLAATYQVMSVAYDPRFFELAAQILKDDGIPMTQAAQSLERMTPACGHLLELIVSGTLAHDGDVELRAHVLNAEKRTNDRGFTLAKSKSAGKIDACIAAALACWELEQAEAPVDYAYSVW